MELYNIELKSQIQEMFVELKNKSEQIISESRTNKEATERIMRVVSGTISAEAEGYVVDIYAGLVKKIKEEDFFQDLDNLSAFYDLNLREELHEKYQFNIEDIDAYKKGIEYKEVNKLYTTAGIAAGTLAVGGILKYALSGVVGIPFALLIAGAVVAACASYISIKSRNKSEYQRAVNTFLHDLEEDILDWVVDIEVYFDKKVRTLYK